MKKLLFFFFVIILIIVAGLTYLGIFPVLSAYAVHPVDLGVNPTPNYVENLEVNYQGLTSPKVALDLTLSDSDVTAVMATWQTRDRNFPLRDVQVKFNPDGTGEASGYLKIGTAVNLAKSLGYSDSDIEKGKNYIKYVAGDLPFYVKGTGGMSNNILSINPSTFQLGRVTVPDNITQATSLVVKDMINRRLTQIGGTNIQSANFVDGSFHLQGTVPATIKYD